MDLPFESRMTRRRVLGSLVAGAALRALPLGAQAQNSITSLSIGNAASHPIPQDYVGLSYESAQLGDPTFFAPDNHELIALFRLLSRQGVLRIGGNSSEFCWWKTKPGQQPPALPSSSQSADNWMPHTFTAIEPVAVDHLDGFLRATGWRAIYGLNLGTGTPQNNAEEAAHVARTLGPRLLYFQIGNEPEYYRNPSNRLRPSSWDFDTYFAEWLAMAHAVLRQVPDARFGGPDVGSNADWVVRFAEQAPKALPGHIVAATGHYYAEGPPDSPSTTIARLLTPDSKFEERVQRMVTAASQSHLDYRMTEGNSCYRGGKPGLSNAFCSSLWAAGFMLRLASLGTAGVNLHGGGAKQIRLGLGGHMPGEKLSPDAAAVVAQGSFYTPIAGSRASGFTARPVFYGMKVAGLFAGGRMRPVQMEVPAQQATAWAAEMPDGSTRVVVLNKDAHEQLTLRITGRSARVWRLNASGLTATSGVSLAGASFRAGHAWLPQHEEHIAASSGAIIATVPVASGAVFFLQN